MNELKTIVRGLREESLAKGKEKDHVPVKSAGPRQKRWATKSRTGCATCRVRRIKCDEAKPSCKRCVLTGRQCGGYQAEASEPSTALTSQVEHPDWDIADAIKYFHTVMLKEVIYHNVGDSMNTSTYTAPTHVSRLHTVDGFIALVVADRIVNACGQANTLPIQGHLPGINHLWAILYKHIQAMIKHLNAQIASRAPAQYSLHAIVDLLSIDLSVMDPTWRSHIEGFAALVKLYGGVQTVLQTKTRTEPMALQYVTIYATLANTASPANNQITGLSNWSHEDIAAAYSHTGFHPAPCPTSVLQDIVRITRLRTMVFGEPEMATAFRPIARDIAERLNDFDPHAWEEPFSTPEDPCSPLAGDLYKTSALLYALQSLPAILAVEFGYVEEQRRHLSVFFAKRHYTDHLYALVHRAMEELPAKQAVSWPMAVLGVAMQDAPQEDKDQIIAYLLRLRKIPGADGGAASIEKKLKDFWFFKQTEWEECYHEPINVIT